MSFYNLYEKFESFNLGNAFNRVSDKNIEKAIYAEEPDVNDFIALISPKAQNYLEQIAQKAHSLTKQYFGRTIKLYTPIYISNYCDNMCAYCGFNSDSKIERKILTLNEIEKEAELIASTGLKDVLMLTGESRKKSPVSYIKSAVKVLKKHFTSISIEVYPLEADEYKALIGEGVDGLTVYQEVYDRKIYDSLHLKGPKKDYLFRLDTPERAAQEGMRFINIGVLLGLNRWEKEVLLLGLHAKYLQDKYPAAEISISVPRIRPQVNNFKPHYNVSDKNIVQIILALRLFLPRLGITLSTRENAAFRENLLPLGITRMSAGSTTAVGGRSIKNSALQFDISDARNVEEIRGMLIKNKFQPVLKDWVGS